MDEQNKINICDLTFYKSALLNSPIGYAYHKIILDNEQNPYDYEFLEVNHSFEKLTSLDKKNIIGKKASEIFSLPNYLIDVFGEISLNGGEKEFEYFSADTDKWFKIHLYSPEKGYFITHFTDTSKEHQEINDVKKLVELSEMLFQSNTQKLDMQKVANVFLSLTKSKCLIFDFLSDNNSSNFVISGDYSILDKLSFLMDTVSSVESNDIIHYENILEFCNKFNITSKLIDTKNLDIGQIVTFKIDHKNTTIGKCILIMPKNIEFINNELLDVFIRQLSLTITKKQNEQKTRKIDEKFKELFNQSCVSMIIHNKETGEIIDANKTAFEMYGFNNLEELKENKFWLESPYSKTDALKYIQKTSKNKTQQFEWLNRKKSGELFWEYITLSLIKINNEEHVLATCINITDNKITQKKLEESEARYRNLVNNIPGAVYRCKCDKNWTMEFISNEIENISLYSADDFINNKKISYSDIIYSEDQHDVEFIVNNGVENHSPYFITYRIKDKNDSIKWVNEYGQAIFNNGTLSCLEGVIIDITEQKKNEQIIEYQSKFQEVIMNMALEYINMPFVKMNTSINSSLEDMGKFVKADRVYVFEYDWKNAVCNNTYEWCAENISPQIDELQGVPNDFISEWVNSHLRGEVIHIPDVSQLPDDDGVKQTLEPQGVVSLITIPMMSENQCIGFVGFDSVKEKKIYTEKERLLLAIFANMLVNIENRYVLEKNLIQEKEKAEAANIAKSNFLANMSHEIRTPMNGILGFLQLLETTPINPKQLEYINIMKNSTDTLLTIINDILDVSKIESGKIELENISFELSSIVENSIINQSVKLKEKNLVLIKNIHPTTPKIVSGDPTRLKQILINLLNNAIKFTEQGEVYLDVYPSTNENGNNVISFSIKDSGIGMDEGTIKKLFKPFTQADNSSTRKYGGTGLGLTICKSYVELMGGKISVSSTIGKGTIFSFYIPLNSTDVIDNDNEKSYSILKNKNIMVIDNNEEFRVKSKLYLQEVGSNSTILSNSTEAISILIKNQSQSFDIIIVEYNMPDIKGEDLYSALKAIPSTKNIPVLFSSHDNLKEISEHFNFIKKPFNKDEFLTFIKNNLT